MMFEVPGPKYVEKYKPDSTICVETNVESSNGLYCPLHSYGHNRVYYSGMD